MRSARIALHLPDLPPLSACNVCLRIYLLSAAANRRLQKLLQYTSSGVFPSPSPARRRSQSVTPPSCHISQARVSFIAVAICAAIWMAANIFYKIIQAAGIVKSNFFVPVPAPAILKKIKRIFLFSIRPKPDFSQHKSLHRPA